MMKPYYETENGKLYCGNCKDVLKQLPENSVEAIVTDPPYELSFMGKKWDNTGIAYNVDMWKECLRVLKPGGYLLSFSGTRTYHRMAFAIEDAGFEIRDMIEWIYGSGFPKSHNIGKAIDKLQGNERINTGVIKHHAQKGVAIAEERGAIGGGAFGQAKDEEITKGTSKWEGWGTALKPAHEPICMARKPLSEKTVAKNVLKYGTGGINIDESRVKVTDIEKESFAKEWDREQSSKQSNRATYLAPKEENKDLNEFRPSGRFPANLIHDNSEEVRECFPVSEGKDNFKHSATSIFRSKTHESTYNGESKSTWGNASRFFKSIIYQAKASKKERNKGCEELKDIEHPKIYADDDWSKKNMGNTPAIKREPVKNNHPTVKPVALIEYLINMVTRSGGTVLDPFAGSGTTGVACNKLNRKFIGIELSDDYCKISKSRIEHSNKEQLKIKFE